MDLVDKPINGLTYLEDLNVLFHPSVHLNRDAFNARVLRLIDRIRDANTCASGVITNTEDPGVEIQRQELINGLWALREQNDIAEMLASPLFTAMTTRKLKYGETSLNAHFFDSYATLVTEPILMVSGQQQILMPSWADALTRIRGQIAWMCEGPGMLEQTLEATNALGPLFPGFVMPSLQENFSALESELKLKAIDIPTTLDGVQATIAFLEGWPDIERPQDELGAALSIAYGLVISNMPTKIRDLYQTDPLMAQFMEDQSIDGIATWARITIIASLKEWHGLLAARLSLQN